MYTGLLHSHSGLAYLLVLASLTTLAIALLTATTGPKPALMRVARALHGVSAGLMGVTAIVGIGLWAKGGWPITAWFAWVGVVALFLQGGLLARGIKPASTIAGTGGPARPWVLLEIAHVVLVLGTFGAMHAR